MKHLKIAILTLVISITGLALFSPVVANALPLNPVVADLKDDANNGLSQVGGGGTSIDSVVSSVVVILSVVAGMAGVIMIIISGIKYTTSGGDAGRVGSAKTTLVYALIGLAIAAAAQFLVHFALSTSSGAQVCPSNSTILANDPNCH
ncbi:MAG TPA: hypothetical protein VK712_00680 [Verrucomicrobiae bacterium]|jgi:hypothetical protein|nr:hypothetical protein [Verrucomicrobiae bacterium]